MLYVTSSKISLTGINCDLEEFFRGITKMKFERKIICIIKKELFENSICLLAHYGSKGNSN